MPKYDNLDDSTVNSVSRNNPSNADIMQTLEEIKDFTNNLVQDVKQIAEKIHSLASYLMGTIEEIKDLIHSLVQNMEQIAKKTHWLYHYISDLVYENDRLKDTIQVLEQKLYSQECLSKDS
ncbi:MAG: hypothetical protein SAJ37_14450 [Oscillatoria sp. PMC 1068.18]|nr:hypothetical protein [Oscillatoria sp. PMC 1076.18]MEC4989928.1 hypothetical protein [Oscillatoria sp. PMC 1068.18]